MCRLLKNICGTVFLPDLAFASALRSGYLSKLMSMYSKPSFCILSLARMQNGQPVIEKIMTRPFMFDEKRLITSKGSFGLFAAPGIICNSGL